jgi:beta-lactamase class A
MRIISSSIALLLLLPLIPKAQNDHLIDSIRVIAAAAKGHTGVVIREGVHQPVTFNGHDHFPLMSVFKFPLALYILDQAEKGKFSLDQRITIRKKDWRKMYSPLLDKYEQDTVPLTIRDLASAAVSFSDNVACDALFKYIGGPAIVNDYIHSLAIAGISIAVTETQMAEDHRNIYRNWCTPLAMDSLLQSFHEGRILSREGTRLLTKWMTETPTGPHRIKAFMPRDAIVIHKTGTSDTERSGITPATNDAGIVMLPDGHLFYIVVFVSDARADETTREAVIARIARLAIESF